MEDFLKTIFFRPAWYVIVINPYFIARRGLYKEIKNIAQSHDNESISILDVGCGARPYQSLFKTKKYFGIDVENSGHKDDHKEVDKYFDGKKIPFENNKFDLVICTQVLEHAEDPEALLLDCSRVLKKDGKLFLTMPLVWNEHEAPYDFRRFTKYGHEQILKKTNFLVLEIMPTCGIFGVCGQLLSAFYFEKIARSNNFMRILVTLILCFPTQLIFILLDKLFKKSWITLDYIILATKK